MMSSLIVCMQQNSSDSWKKKSWCSRSEVTVANAVYLCLFSRQFAGFVKSCPVIRIVTLSTSFEVHFHFFFPVPLPLDNTRLPQPVVEYPSQHPNTRDFLRTVYCDKRLNLCCVSQQQRKFLSSFWLKDPFNDRQQYSSVLHEQARKCHIGSLMQRGDLSREIVHFRTE